MDLEHLQGYILIVLIFAVAALGVWYLAVRFNQRRLKIIAVMLVVFPLLAIGLGIASSVFDLGVSSEFNDTAVGPARGEASVTREFPFQVNDETALQEIQLSPRTRAGDTPAAPIQLKMSVLSPSGKTMVEKTETLAPAKGLYWSVLQANFQPIEHGEHSMKLEIPSGVSEVRVRVREIKK